MNNQASAPPPAYSLARPVQRLSRLNQRPLATANFILAFAGMLWCGFVGVNHLQYIGKTGETTGMKVFDLIQGIAYMMMAVILLLGVAVCIKRNPRLARYYSFGSAGVVVLALLVGVVEIVGNYTQKKGIIAQCTTNSIGEQVSYGWYSQTLPLTEEQAAAYCNRLWSRQAWQDWIWLLAEVFFAFVASTFAFGWARQLASPAPSDNSGISGPDQSYGVPLQPYQSRVPDYVPAYAPAYPGPPAGGLPDGDLKSPGTATAFSGVPISAQDEAWNTSLAESERREWEQHRANEAASASTGRRQGNEQEDEAWDQARQNAGTAAYAAGGNPFAPRAGAREDGGRVV